MNIRKTIVKILSTFFYIGYLPLIPGTFGSLAGLFLFWLTKNEVILYSGLTLILIIFGFLVTGEAEEIFHKKDAKFIVIDEVSGMLVALLFLPYNLKTVIIGFFLFRLLDTLKPFPANKLEQLKGSLGVMADDIIAGLYTNIILQIVFRVTSFKTS